MDGRSRTRLYSIILLPLLFALFGVSSNDGPDALEREIDRDLEEHGIELELDLPAERQHRGPEHPSEAETPRVDAVVRGQVRDGRTSALLEGVEVALPELDRRCVTDEQGRYTLEGVPPRLRPYEVLISKPGYKSSFGDVHAPKTEQVRRDFELVPVAW